MRERALPAWWLPSVRAIPWWPLAGAGAVTAVVAVTLRFAGPSGPAGASGTLPIASPVIAAIAAALIVGAVVLGLDDPARDVLAALPTGLGVRLLHRLVLLGPVAAVLVVLLDASVRAGIMAAACAFAGVALLASTWAARRRADLACALGAATPLAWVLWSTAAGGDGALADVGRAWSTQPWPVAILAASAVVWLHQRHR